LFITSLLLLATGDPEPGVIGVFLWLIAVGLAVLNVVVVVALGRRRVGRRFEAAWDYLPLRPLSRGGSSP
jgi:cytochrome c-type biogenesis protein CcmH/NrfF